MFSVGLTGGIGSGKTTVAARFAQYGIEVIDTDCIAHALTTATGVAMPLIKAQFGQAYIAPDGSLDRANMRKLVFSDKCARRRLEAILHPLILNECAHAAQTAKGAYLMLVVPLLTELEAWKAQVDRVLVVNCSEETQITRAIQRSCLSREQVLSILAHQASKEERLACADDVICNDESTTLAYLYQAIDGLHRQYLDQCL